MEFEEFKKQLDQLVKKIETVVNGLEINDIIGISTVYDGVPDAKKCADKFLKESHYNKIRVENVIVLSNVNNTKALTQNDENQRIQNEVLAVLNYFLIEVEKLAALGEYKYELNELFKELIQFLDLKMEKMNYDKWHKEHDPAIREMYGFVLLDNERFAYRFDSLDFSSYCKDLINSSFLYRKQKLQHLKNIIVNIFSKYLFLPDLKVLPKLSFKCRQTDICELILFMEESQIFNEPKHVTAFLLGILDITSKQYNDAIKDVNKRTKERGHYLSKLLENFNKD